VFATVIADLSRLPADHFWNMMAFHSWVHPYDSKGRRRPYSELPKTVKSMEDDPYRSLAGELRAIGGFAKDSSPGDRLTGSTRFRAVSLTPRATAAAPPHRLPDRRPR
jgi:hypothetical protein